MLKIFFLNLFLIQAVWALELKQVVSTQGQDQVTFSFDSKINSNQIRLETFRDVIQVSVEGAKVFPAKIQSLENEEFTKIFAYQYTPKVLRLRVSTKKDAVAYKDQIKLEVHQSQVIVKLEKQAKGVELKTEHSAAKVEKVEKIEKKETKALAVTKTAPVNSSSQSSSTLQGLLKSFLALLVVIPLFLISMVLLKKFKKGGFKKNSMIEMVANYQLAPKKSVAVMRIKDQLLVVGITDESINLIAKLGGDDEIDQFEKTLTSSTMTEKTIVRDPFSPFEGSARDRIREKLKGMSGMA